MEELIETLTRCDPKDRLDVGEKVLAQLPAAVADATDFELSQLANAYGAWLKGSNFKVHGITHKKKRGFSFCVRLRVCVRGE